MHFNILVLTTILSATILFVGCSGGGGGGTPANSDNRNAANGASSNAAAAGSNADNPLATTRREEAPTSNNAPTLTPVVQGYYDALRRKDEAGVKKFLSQAAIKYNEAEMKEEKKTSLIAYLEDSEYPVGEKREVRNERIEGDSGVAEIKGGSLGTWTPVAFVRENGEWKFEAADKSFKNLQEIRKP